MRELITNPVVLLILLIGGGMGLVFTFKVTAPIIDILRQAAVARRPQPEQGVDDLTETRRNTEAILAIVSEKDEEGVLKVHRRKSFDEAIENIAKALTRLTDLYEEERHRYAAR